MTLGSIFIGMLPSLLLAEMGSGDLGMLGSMGPVFPTIEHKFSFYPRRNIPAQGESVQQFTQDLVVKVPVSQTEKETWTLRGNLQQTQINTGAKLNGNSLPERLWILGTGVNYRYALEDRRVFGVDLGVGSASDRPFYSFNEIALNATVTYALPQGEKDSWLLLINYSNLRPFLNHIPIPGVAYSHNPSRELRALFGLPFTFLYWQFTSTLNLTTFISPFSAFAQLAYTLSGQTQCYAVFSWNTQTYLIAERTTKENRFFHVQKSTGLGVRFPIGEDITVDFAGNYTFDREYYEGESYRTFTGSPVAVDAGFGFLSQLRLKI